MMMLSLLLLNSCGKSVVELEDTYEPKIVIQAFIYPGQKVSGILITRNIPINTTPTASSLVLSDADVRIKDIANNKEYKLTFNSQKLFYEYNDNFTIDFNSQYELTVTADIDGTTLHASSITITPQKGFSILHDKTISGDISYREKDLNGNVKEIPLVFNISQGTTFYPISLVALNASDTTFIYNNAYQNVEREDVIKNLDNYKYRQRQVFNVNPVGDIITYDINWISIWFYSRYRMIVYASDENYRTFLLTYKGVQEFDGNFHEPKININGDGIGVFASMVADTVYFNVKK